MLIRRQIFHNSEFQCRSIGHLKSGLNYTLAEGIVTHHLITVILKCRSKNLRGTGAVFIYKNNSLELCPAILGLAATGVLVQPTSGSGHAGDGKDA